MNLCKDKSLCCGCGACSNVCPTNAIGLEIDGDGFRYPVIDPAKCIRCGACLRTCNFKKPPNRNQPLHSYAAVASDSALQGHSSSGGVFSALAKCFLQNKGVVYGCAWHGGIEKLTPCHVRIDSVPTLPCLQGSKYVQSDMRAVFAKVKKDLENHRQILFSGTPCQIDALKGVLENKIPVNLHLVDIVCHGTPSVAFFHAYLDFLGNKWKGRITDFLFRDKTRGWGILGTAVLDKNGHLYRRPQNTHNSAFYHAFMSGDIYRDSCYKCKYASTSRPGDITLGDFWGIEKEFPQWLSDAGGDWIRRNGISCVLINTAKGQELLDSCADAISMREVPLETITRHNGQLLAPMQKSPRRDALMMLFRQKGYEGVHRWFLKQLGCKRWAYWIWDSLPLSASNAVRRLVRHKR